MYGVGEGSDYNGIAGGWIFLWGKADRTALYLDYQEVVTQHIDTLKFTEMYTEVKFYCIMF